MVLLYAHDLMDKELLDSGQFQPLSKISSPRRAIAQVLQLLKQDFESKLLKYELNIESIEGVRVQFD